MAPPDLISANAGARLVAFVADDQEVIAAGLNFYRWRKNDGAQLACVAGNGELVACGISNDRTILAAALVNSVELRRTDSFDLIRVVRQSDRPLAVAISVDNQLLAVQSRNAVNVFSLANLSLVATCPCSVVLFRGVCFLPDGRIACLSDRNIEGSSAAGVEIHDLKSGSVTALELPATKMPNCESLSFWDGRLYGCRTYDICEYEAESGQLLKVIPIGYSRVLPLPRRSILAAGGLSQEIGFYEPSSGNWLRQLKGHTGIIISLDRSQDQSWVVSCSSEGDVRLWDVGTALKDPESYTLVGDEIASQSFWGSETSLRFRSDGTGLQSCNVSMISAWSLPDLKPVPSISDEAKIRAVQFLTDDEVFVRQRTEHEDGSSYRVALYDLATGQIQRVGDLPRDLPPPIALNHAKTLMAAFEDDSLYLMSFPDCNLLHKIRTHEGEVSDSRFSALKFASDDRLLTSGRNGTLHEWQPESGQLLRAYQCDGPSIETFCLSPDESLLAISESFAIVILDSLTWDEVVRIPCEQQVYWSRLAISNDNKTLAFVSTHLDDITLYDLPSGQLVATLKGHSSGITNVCFSPDDCYLATTSDDHCLKLWKSPRKG